MTTAMEFVEDHIVNNHTIDQDVKLKLLLSEEMAPYSFLGTLYPLSMIITEVSEEEQAVDGDLIDEVMKIYDMLTRDDIYMMIKSEAVIQRLESIK